MSTTFPENVYRAFGLIISSEIVLPELTSVSMINDIVDVKIEKAELSTLWSGAIESGRVLYHKA